MTNLQREIKKCPVPVIQVKSIKKWLSKSPLAKGMNEVAGCFVSYRKPRGSGHIILLKKSLPTPIKVFILFHEIDHYNRRKQKQSAVEQEFTANIHAITMCLKKGYTKSLIQGMGLIRYLAKAKGVAQHDHKAARKVLATIRELDERKTHSTR